MSVATFGFGYVFVLVIFIVFCIVLFFRRAKGVCERHERYLQGLSALYLESIADAEKNKRQKCSM